MSATIPTNVINLRTTGAVDTVLDSFSNWYDPLTHQFNKSQYMGYAYGNASGYIGQGTSNNITLYSGSGQQGQVVYNKCPALCFSMYSLLNWRPTASNQWVSYAFGDQYYRFSCTLQETGGVLYGRLNFQNEHEQQFQLASYTNTSPRSVIASNVWTPVTVMMDYNMAIKFNVGSCNLFWCDIMDTTFPTTPDYYVYSACNVWNKYYLLPNDFTFYDGTYTVAAANTGTYTGSLPFCGVSNVTIVNWELQGNATFVNNVFGAQKYLYLENQEPIMSLSNTVANIKQTQWSSCNADIIYATGNVGIGTTTAPSSKLQVHNGTITHTYIPPSQSNKRYPPFSRAGASTFTITQANHGIGTYTASTVNNFGNNGFAISGAFDGSMSSAYISGDSAQYTNGAFTGTTGVTITVNGTPRTYTALDFDLLLPIPVCVGSVYVLWGDVTSLPSSFVLVGTNDGVNWIEINTTTGLTNTTQRQVVYQIGSTTFYNRYKFLVTGLIATATTKLRITDFAYIGYESVEPLTTSMQITNQQINASIPMHLTYNPVSFTNTEIRVYPPVSNFTADSNIITGQPYGNGKYMLFSQNIQTVGGSNDLFYAFDGIVNTRWFNNSFNYTNQVWLGGATRAIYCNGIPYIAPDFSIMMPQSIVPTSFSVLYNQLTNQFPNEHHFFGSADGANWDLIYSSNNMTGWTNRTQTYTFPVSTQNTYSYFKYLVTRHQSSATNVAFTVNDFKIYGYERVYDTSQKTSVYASNALVGIGTSAPRYNLDVNGTISGTYCNLENTAIIQNMSSQIVSNSNNLFTLSNTVQTHLTNYASFSNSTNASITSIQSSVTNLQTSITNTQTSVINLQNDTKWQALNQAIYTYSNVGIKTNVPTQYDLQINGSIFANGYCNLDQQSVISTINASIQSQQSAISTINTSLNNQQTSISSINTSITNLQTSINNKVSSQWVTKSTNIYYSTGFVGIGMSDPVHTLNVNGDLSARTFSLAANYDYAVNNQIPWYGIGAQNNIVYLTGYNGIRMKTASADPAVFVNSSGYVGINNASPSERLEVTGNIKTTGLVMGNKTVIYRSYTTLTFSTTWNVRDNIYYSPHYVYLNNLGLPYVVSNPVDVNKYMVTCSVINNNFLNSSYVVEKFGTGFTITFTTTDSAKFYIAGSSVLTYLTFSADVMVEVFA